MAKQLASLQLYASGIIYEDARRLVEASSDEVYGRARSQFLFSYIIQRQSWKDAKVWVNRTTGETYEDESDIPSEQRVHYSTEDRWPTQKSFVEWCTEHVPGFSEVTMRTRHRTIDRLCEMGIELPKAVWIVAGLRMVSASDRIARLFSYTEFNELDGVQDVDAILNLPTLTESLGTEVHEALVAESRPEERKAILQDNIEAVRDAAETFLDEAASRVADGVHSPTQSSIGIGRTLQNEPKIHFFIPDKEVGFPWAIKAITYDESLGDYDSGKEQVIFVCFMDGETGEVLDELPPEVDVWWQKRVARRVKDV